MSFVYLASPYSHADPDQIYFRYRSAVRAAAQLMRGGEVVFSPIAHSHAIGEIIGKKTDHEFWMNQDRPILRHASKVVVLRLPGWEMSRGVQEEVKIANQIGIPVEYMDL